MLVLLGLVVAGCNWILPLGSAENRDAAADRTGDRPGQPPLEGSAPPPDDLFRPGDLPGPQDAPPVPPPIDQLIPSDTPAPPLTDLLVPQDGAQAADTTPLQCSSAIGWAGSCEPSLCNRLCNDGVHAYYVSCSLQSNMTVCTCRVDGVKVGNDVKYPTSPFSCALCETAALTDCKF